MVRKKFTTEEFIQKAREVHGDKYDYSKVEYVNSQTKVTVICYVHGEFKQTPNLHLSGRKCNRCSGHRKTTEDFIKQAKAMHGDRYDYSKTIYIKAKTKLIITCPEHGDFPQTPTSHLGGNRKGSGCPRCKGKGKNTERFIEIIKKTHGNKYDYSKVEYVDSYTKVVLGCYIHGEFLIRPYNLMDGRGCVLCGRNKIKYVTYKEAKRIIRPHMEALTELLGRKVTIPDYKKWWEENKDYCDKMGVPKKPDAFYMRNPDSSYKINRKRIY